MAVFDNGAGEVPFFAMPGDCEAHGRELFVRAMNGEFGEIRNYEPAPVDLVKAKQQCVDAIGRMIEGLRNSIPDSILEIDDDTQADAAWQERVKKIERERMRAVRAVARASRVEEIDAAFTALNEGLKL